jgi:hypothetical protein
MTLQDSRSSNGTMVYLQGPLPLPNNETIRLRMGRSTLSIRAKRSLAASFRALHRSHAVPNTVSLARLQEIMALAPPYIPRSIRQPIEDPHQPSQALQNISQPIQSVLDDSFPQSVLPQSTIDGALILGPERREGVSTREVSPSSSILRLIYLEL